MGEDITEREKSPNQVINTDSSCYQFMGDPIAEAGNGERNKVGPQNIYVGQWDQIKEKMIWNVVEGSKEGTIQKVGLGEATSSRPRHISDAKKDGMLMQAFSLGPTKEHSRKKVLVRAST
jgi:hypothetical protein